MNRLNVVINDDFRNADKYIEDGSIDLVVTSPPYNIDLGNNKYNKSPYDLYIDNKDHRKYLLFLHQIFVKVYDKLKPGGRVVINIGDGKNGAVPTHSDVIKIMVGIGFIPHSTIIWDKHTTSNRAAFGSFVSPSSPSFPCPFEYILIFAKEFRRLKYKGMTDLTKDEFVEWAYGIWSFAPEKNKKDKHPSPFPRELPHRAIKMLSWVGATVLDPMCGSGTTLAEAKILKRNYIGFDISEQYCETSRDELLKA